MILIRMLQTLRTLTDGRSALVLGASREPYTLKMARSELVWRMGTGKKIEAAPGHSTPPRTNALAELPIHRPLSLSDILSLSSARRYAL